jgi:hypothetical protein
LDATKPVETLLHEVIEKLKKENVLWWIT